MKFCQNIAEAFGFHFSFRLSRSAYFVKTFATIQNFVHSWHLSASYNKQAANDFDAKSAIFVC